MQRAETGRLAGVWVSVTGGAVSIVTTLVIFVMTYGMQLQAEIARGSPTEALLASFVLPVVALVGLIGGVLWLVAAYGFGFQRPWAFSAAVVGSVLCILGGFFPILPWVSSGLGFPPTSVVFVLNLVLFLVLQTRVRHNGRGVLIFSLSAGIAYALAFINGVASTHYILTTGEVYFILLQPVNFTACAMWGAAAVGVVLRRWWAEPTVLAGGIASSLGGIPIAVLTQTELSRPSLFWPSPLLAVTLIAVFLLTKRGRSIAQSI